MRARVNPRAEITYLIKLSAFNKNWQGSIANLSIIPIDYAIRLYVTLGRFGFLRLDDSD